MLHSFSTLTVLLLHGLFSMCLCELPPPDKPYKILMLLPLSSRSHENVFVPLAEALAERGHEVTMIKNTEMKSRHPRIHEIRHNLEYVNPSSVDLSPNWGKIDTTFQFFDERLPRLARDLYKVPKVMQIYKRRHEFDVVIIDQIFNEMAFPFAHEMPFIMLSPPGLEPGTSAILGNVLNPSYAFSQGAFFRNPMTFIERLKNLAAHFMQLRVFNMIVLPKIQAEISEQFPDLPSLMDIKKNVSLTLLNSDHTYGTSVPLLPSQVEIGGIHCSPAKPLPKDLSTWIEGSGNEGVIYFSIGSVARGSNMPQEYIDIFVAAFAQMPQRVIWKFENEDLPGISENVLLRKWLPQQDILAQEKVKVFITHGGLLSTQEAIYHGTPLIALPIFGDQPRNCEMISVKGYGLCLQWKDLTVDVFVSALKEIIENKRYSQRVAETSLVFRDKKDTPVDRAVWWTEFVIRHQGAPSLECPGRNLSWLEFFLIDVILLLHVIFFVVVWLLKKCKRRLASIVWSASKKKNELEMSTLSQRWYSDIDHRNRDNRLFVGVGNVDLPQYFRLVSDAARIVCLPSSLKLVLSDDVILLSDNDSLYGSDGSHQSDRLYINEELFYESDHASEDSINGTIITPGSKRVRVRSEESVESTATVGASTSGEDAATARGCLVWEHVQPRENSAIDRLETPRWSSSRFTPTLFPFTEDVGISDECTATDDSEELESQMEGDKLAKIRIVLEDIREKFSSKFKPFRDLCIDESLVLWRGRLSFRQFMPLKRHRFGMKLFTLCDVESGYILDFILYTGGGTDLNFDSELGYSGSVPTPTNIAKMLHSFSTLTVMLLHGLFSICLCELPPPDKPYKILMLLPLSSRSHENAFVPLAEALAERGHEVTMIKNTDMKSRHPRIHEIRHNLEYVNPSSVDFSQNWGKIDAAFQFFDECLPRLARDLYKVPKVMQIYKRRHEFDVVIIDQMFNEMAFPFAHEMPFIMLSPPGLEPGTSAILGNVLNPSYAFSQGAFFRNPMTFIERLKNLAAHFMQLRVFSMSLLPKIQAEISEQFPELPSLMDIKKNVSLTLLNSDHTYDTSVPLLPSQVEIGGIHCRPAKPLPKDLSTWIEGSGNEGVIYFSIGSVARGSNIPQEYFDIFVAAFAQMPQRVIWKFENENLPGISENVLLRKWLPQQDILAQEKVKVFITHGGLLSTQEAIYHGTPLIALPIFGDQPRNCEMISVKGYGLCLQWKDLTVDVFVSALKEIIENKRYSQRVAETSLVFRDKKDTPVDRAVWWTEFVIRHQGAPSLECPGRNLSWLEFFLIDVILLLHVIFFVVVWLLKKCKRRLASIVWSASKKKNE
ncbi:uncharacterized protein LOC143029976 [Oratosquilla oratoria]|uniref:uncharacterized protein LOC143029976 n=1 Tax=Oratosquilla oratoria TaxID=337810 RepID=UPI003F76D3CC